MTQRDTTTRPVPPRVSRLDRIWPAAVGTSCLIAVLRLNTVSKHLSAQTWLVLQLLPLVLASIVLVLGPAPPSPRRLRAVGLAAAGLVAWCTASTAWSVDPTRTLSQSVVFIVVIGFLYLSATRRWTFDPLRDLPTLFWIGVTVLVAGIALRLAGIEETVGIASRLQGVMGNPNFDGILAATVLFIGVVLVAERPLTPRLLAAISSGCGLAGVVLLWSGSRGAMVAVLAFCAYYLVFSSGLRAKLRAGARVATISFGAAFAVGVGSWVVATTAPISDVTGGATSQAEALFNRGTVHTDVTSGRIELWRQYAHLSRDRPVLGHGYRTAEQLLDNGVSAHNIALSFLVETGVVGLALALWLLVQILRTVPRRPFAWGDPLLPVLIALGVQEMVESTLQAPSGLTALLQWTLVFALVTNAVHRSAERDI